MVRQAAVMENDPPGFFSLPRGAMEDPLMVWPYQCSDEFNFHGKLECLKPAC